VEIREITLHTRKEVDLNTHGSRALRPHSADDSSHSPTRRGLLRADPAKGLFSRARLLYYRPHRLAQEEPRMAEPQHRAPPVADVSARDEQQDVELIRAVARRDRSAFERLYYRHSPRLGRYLMRILRQREAVEEALNDVMLVVWQNAARFDPSGSRLSTWLFGIAHNKALKALASFRTRSSEVAMEPVQLDADAESDNGSAECVDSNDPERALAGRQLGVMLARALERLSPEHRTVIELAFGEDCSYQEIASITGSPVNTVKTRMFYARKHLAEILRRLGVPDLLRA
jgi:RNA polymerase sigma-70 factor, ECF subfamily